MSELLDEAKRRLEHEQEEFIMGEPGYEDTDNYQRGLNDAWQEAVKLIAKYEHKPKGLLSYVPSPFDKHTAKQPKLTEKQEEILKTLRRFYKDSADMLSAIYDTINTTCFNSNDDFIPALRKFLNEVQP